MGHNPGSKARLLDDASPNAVHLSASIRNMVYWYLVVHSIYCGCVPCLNSIGPSPSVEAAMIGRLSALLLALLLCLAALLLPKDAAAQADPGPAIETKPVLPTARA